MPRIRYEAEPRKNIAYRKAWDILWIYGEQRELFKPADLEEWEADEVWEQAKRDCSWIN